MKNISTGLIVLLATVAPAPFGAASAKHAYLVVTIDAGYAWQRVPLRLGGRGELHFDARGRWVFNPSQPPVDANGDRNLPTAGRVGYTFSGAGGYEGELVGRIGRGGAPFAAGARGVHEVARREVGPLYLMINDDDRSRYGAGLRDNSGKLRVRIDYDR